MSENCESCKYWDNKASENDELGDCRRFPPVKSDLVCKNQVADGASLEDAEWVATSFPITIETDWCGEWKAR